MREHAGCAGRVGRDVGAALHWGALDIPLPERDAGGLAAGSQRVVAASLRRLPRGAQSVRQWCRHCRRVGHFAVVYECVGRMHRSHTYLLDLLSRWSAVHRARAPSCHVYPGDKERSRRHHGGWDGSSRQKPIKSAQLAPCKMWQTLRYGRIKYVVLVVLEGKPKLLGVSVTRRPSVRADPQGMQPG